MIHTKGHTQMTPKGILDSDAVELSLHVKRLNKDLS